MTTADKIAELKAQLAALTETLEELEEENNAPKVTDVTDDCDVELGTNDAGSIRMYLVHDGTVITRAGLGKGLELTSAAQSAGYALVADPQKTVRGSYFRVTLSN